MMMPDSERETIHSFARELAVLGGSVAMRWFRDADLVSERKSDQTPVTVADRNAEKEIRSAIRKRFPDHGVVGEEYGEEYSTRRHRWIIDPIDGTKSFIRGVPLFTTLVAFVDGSEVETGVIYAPATGEMVSAYRGGGAYDEQNRTVSVSRREVLSEAWVLTTDPVDFYRRRPSMMRNLLARSSAIRTWADAYGYMLVARGDADVIIDPIMSVWDIAPLSVIVREAGGHFTDINGHIDDLGSSAIASASEPLHRSVLECD